MGRGRFTHVLFDAVGTLIFPSPSVAEVYQQAAQSLGLSLSQAEVSRRFKIAYAQSAYPSHVDSSLPSDRVRWQQVVSQVLDELTAEHKTIAFEQLWHHFAQPSAWQLFDDAAAALNELQQQGQSLAIASNFDERLHLIVEGHPLLSHFKNVFVSSDLGFAKPHPSFFQQVSQQLSVHPSELLLVGDDLDADVLGGLSAGWTGVWIQRKSNPSTAASTLLEATHSSPQAQNAFAISSLMELPSLFLY